MVKNIGEAPAVSDATKTAAEELCGHIFSQHPEVQRALVFVNTREKRIRCRAILGEEIPGTQQSVIAQTIIGEAKKSMISPLLPGHSITPGDISFEVSGVEQSTALTRVIFGVKSLLKKYNIL